MLAALFAFLLLGATAPASRPSFACSGALSPTEQAICADLELAAWDRAQAKVYRALDGTSDHSLEAQRGWLARRDSCGASRACLLTAYRGWPGFSFTAWGIGRSFERAGTGRRDATSLDVTPIHGNWYHFSLSALHQQTADPGSTNMGIYGGLFELKNGIGVYNEGPEDFSCRFTIERNRRSGWTLSEFGENPKCGGLNVFISGEFVPVKRRRK